MKRSNRLYAARRSTIEAVKCHDTIRYLSIIYVNHIVGTKYYVALFFTKLVWPAKYLTGNGSFNADIVVHCTNCFRYLELNSIKFCTHLQLSISALSKQTVLRYTTKSRNTSRLLRRDHVCLYLLYVLNLE